MIIYKMMHETSTLVFDCFPFSLAPRSGPLPYIPNRCSNFGVWSMQFPYSPVPSSCWSLLSLEGWGHTIRAQQSLKIFRFLHSMSCSQSDFPEIHHFFWFGPWACVLTPVTEKALNALHWSCLCFDRCRAFQRSSQGLPIFHSRTCVWLGLVTDRLSETGNEERRRGAGAG